MRSWKPRSVGQIVKGWLSFIGAAIALFIVCALWVVSVLAAFAVPVAILWAIYRFTLAFT